MNLPADLNREVDQTLRAESPGELGQLVDLVAGRAAPAGGDDRLHPAAARERLVEHPEATRRLPCPIDEGRCEVDELHPEAQVGLVGAEALERLRRR